MLGPIAGSKLVHWEALVPIKEIRTDKCPLLMILYCLADDYDHVAETIKMRSIQLKKPPFRHPVAPYKNPYDMPVKRVHDLLGVCNDLPTKDHLTEFWTKNKDGHPILNGLNIRLLDHQLEGINWMIDREKNKNTRGGFLADVRSILIFDMRNKLIFYARM